MKTEVNPPNNNIQYVISTNEYFSTANGGIYANYRSNAYNSSLKLSVDSQQNHILYLMMAHAH